MWLLLDHPPPLVYDMPDPPTVRCLYYPYSRALSLRTLKRAVLLFDQVGFIDTQPAFVRHDLLSHVVPDPQERLGLESAYQFLEAEGVVELIDPGNMLIEHDSLITRNVITDISDNEYCQIAVRHSANDWAVLRSRIPPTLLKELYPGAGTYAEAISLQAIIQAGGDKDRIAHPQVRNFATFRWPEMSGERAEEYFLQSRYRYVIGGNPYVELEALKLPFLHASSLRTNEALLIASLGDWIPFTDSQVHNNLLMRKVQLAKDRTASNPAVIQYYESDLPLSLPASDLAVSLLDRLISDEELDRRSFEDIVIYRRQNADPLRRLREKLAEFAAGVNVGKAGPEYFHEINRLVDSKLVPEIGKIRDDLTTKYEDAFGKLKLRSAQVTVPTLVGSVFGGLSIPAVLLACVAAEAAMLGTAGVAETVKVWQTRRESRRSSFSYLLGL